MEAYTIAGVRQFISTTSTSLRYIDDMDIAKALHWYLADNYSGQGSEMYRALCELGYMPDSYERGPGDGDAGRIYTALVKGAF